MIKDYELEFSDGQVLTASAVSTNIIDQGAAGDAIAGGEMFLVIRCGTLLDSAGEAATLTVKLQDDSDVAFGTVRDVYVSAAIAEAAIAANTELLKIRLPLGLKRYLRVSYVVGTENFTTGTIDAFLVSGVDTRMP